MEADKNIPEELFDLNQMQEMAAGDPQFLVAMSKIYIDTIPAISRQLVDASNAGQWATASKLAHRLKSTIDSLNMYSIKGDIRIIELDARNKVNKEIVKALALKVDGVIRIVAEKLKKDFSL
jgi:HPt (histidine-containing phosphotransfer) domain-containing protein